jgi:hypothetical protein
MNLRAGRPAAGPTAPRRPVSEAIAEAPPARGWRRLRTHMRSQYDREASCKLHSAAMPDSRRPEPGGRNRNHFDVEDIASELQRLKGTDVELPQRDRDRPGSQQIRRKNASGTQSSSSSQRHHASHDSGGTVLTHEARAHHHDPNSPARRQYGNPCARGPAMHPRWINPRRRRTLGSSEIATRILALEARDLPAGKALRWLVGEPHQRPDRLLVGVATGRHLLVDRERERGADMPDLRCDPLGVTADHRRERRPGAPQRVRRDLWQRRHATLPAV